MAAKKKKVSPDIQERSHDRAPAERWQHGDHDDYALDENRPRWRVQRTRMAADLLHARGDIAQEQHNAAIRYRREHERGLMGSSMPTDDVRGSGNGMACFMDLRIAAVHSIRLADQAVGGDGKALLNLFILCGHSFSAAEERLVHEGHDVLGAPSRKVLKTRFIDTLDRLARHYSGDLYRLTAPKLEPEVREVRDAHVHVVRPTLDLSALRQAVEARTAEYERIGASDAAVALLLRGEFGEWAEKFSEMAG